MSEMKKDAPAAKEGEGNTQKPQAETLETLGVQETDADKNRQIAQDQRKRAEKAEAAKAEAEQRAESLQAEVTKLKSSAMSGDMPMGEVNDQLRKLAEEHNVDQSFLAKLVSTVRSATVGEIRAELEKDLSPKINSIEQERRMEKAEKKFDEVFSKTVGDMPEYKGIVNKEIIKTLAFNPANAKKTLPQIIEDAYGAAVQGRKTIETAHASKELESPNFQSPTKEDWDRIETDPKAREAWSKSAEQQIRSYL